MGKDAIEVIAISLFIGYRCENLAGPLPDVESEIDYWLHMNPVAKEVWYRQARNVRKGIEVYAANHR